MELQNVNQQAADLEVWVDVRGYNGVYQVSNLCRVRTTGMTFKDKNGKSYVRKPKFVTVFVNTNGYLAVGLSKNKKQKQWLLHRLIAIHFISNPENKPEVNHKNGIKTDASIDNLEWCTKSENTIHAFATGLMDIRGEKHMHAKLDNEKVLAIRKNCKHKKDLVIYAKKYNVSVGTVYDAFKSITWTHI